MSSITALFKEFSYRPRKSAGQNFLTDFQILDQIEQAVQCPPGDVLLEVGGGYGAFTERLAKKGRLLTVVEPDHKLFAMLERKFGKTQGMALVKADILKLDLKSFAPPAPGLITLAGNIPYFLTTPLMTRLLTQFHSIIRKIYLMVQKEVADRLTAKPGTKAYGALTLCAQYYSIPRKIIEVPARCFKPRPKVDSAFYILGNQTIFSIGRGERERLFRFGTRDTLDEVRMETASRGSDWISLTYGTQCNGQPAVNSPETNSVWAGRRNQRFRVSNDKGHFCDTLSYG